MNAFYFLIQDRQGVSIRRIHRSNKKKEKEKGERKKSRNFYMIQIHRDTRCNLVKQRDERKTRHPSYFTTPTVDFHKVLL